MNHYWFVCPECRRVEVTSIYVENIIHHHGNTLYKLICFRNLDEAMPSFGLGESPSADPVIPMTQEMQLSPALIFNRIRQFVVMPVIPARKDEIGGPMIPMDICYAIEFELENGEKVRGTYTTYELLTRLAGFWDHPKVKNWSILEPK